MTEPTCQVLRILGAAMMGAGLYGAILRRGPARDAGGTVEGLQDVLEARTREAREAEAERDRLRAELSRATGRGGTGTPDA